MTADHAGRDVPGEHETATAAKGTAVPVDVTVDPRARKALAVFLAGPVILLVHFMVVYLVAEAGCTGDGPGLDVFDPPVPAVATLAATGVAAVACIGSAAWAWRRCKTGRHTGDPRADAAGGALVDREPLAFAGLVMSLLALVTVLLVGLPALVLQSC